MRYRRSRRGCPSFAAGALQVFGAAFVVTRGPDEASGVPMDCRQCCPCLCNLQVYSHPGRAWQDRYVQLTHTLTVMSPLYSFCLWPAHHLAKLKKASSIFLCLSCPAPVPFKVEFQVYNWLFQASGLPFDGIFSPFFPLFFIFVVVVV